MMFLILCTSIAHILYNLYYTAYNNPVNTFIIPVIQQPIFFLLSLCLNFNNYVLILQPIIVITSTYLLINTLRIYIYIWDT